MTFLPNRSIAGFLGLLALAAGNAWSDASSQPAMDPGAPLSSMVAVVLQDPGPTNADNLADYIKQLVALYNTDRAKLSGVRFPLENATTDTVRVLDGLQHNVVVKWLDPLTLAEGPEAPRFGANADYLAYFGDGWNADWAAGGIGSPPLFSGSGTSGWVWSNHEYVSNKAPTPTSAPTGQHLTLARFLRGAGVLANDVESDLWARRDVDSYIRQEKRQVGGSWFHVVQDDRTGAWHLDRDAPNRRYDATSATRLLVTGTRLSGLDDRLDQRRVRAHQRPQRPSHARRVRLPERDRSRPAERVQPGRRRRPPEAGRRGARPLGERQHRHRRWFQADPGAAGRDVRGQ